MQYWTKSTNVYKAEVVVTLSGILYRETKCNKLLFMLTSLDNKYPSLFTLHKVIYYYVFTFKYIHKYMHLVNVVFKRRKWESSKQKKRAVL